MPHGTPLGDGERKVEGLGCGSLHLLQSKLLHVHCFYKSFPSKMSFEAKGRWLTKASETQVGGRGRMQIKRLSPVSQQHTIKQHKF